MADTRGLKEIAEFVISKISSEINSTLECREIPIGIHKRLKRFDGINPDASVVVQVINHGGYTSGGKLPSAKIKNTYADCYFLSLTKAKRKILAFSNEEFYNIFKDKSEGYLHDIELMYVKLPKELSDKANIVLSNASEEMQK